MGFFFGQRKLVALEFRQACNTDSRDRLHRDLGSRSRLLAVLGLGFLGQQPIQIMLTQNSKLPTNGGTNQESTVALTVTVNEAATLLGVSEPTVYRLVSRRMLKILPGLRHKRITRRSLDAYSSGVVAD